jgi:hypothetical protein
VIQGVSIGTGFLGLDWARTEAGPKRPQRHVRQHQQTMRSISAQLIHYRCSRRDPLCKAPWYGASAMAHSIVGTAAYQGRCPCAGQLFHAGRRACILRAGARTNAETDVIASAAMIIRNCICPPAVAILLFNRRQRWSARPTRTCAALDNAPPCVVLIAR